MTTLAQRVVRQHGFLAALSTAGGVFAAVVVGQVVQSVVTLLIASYGGGAGYSGAYGWVLVVSPMLLAVPFGLGVLISLWFIAPIASELRLFHVLTRALLASAVGSVLSGIVSAIVQFVSSLSVNGSLFGNSFPAIRYEGPDVILAILWAVQSMLNSFLGLTPLVLLAGVLLWIWLGRYPAKHQVSGMIDKV